MTYRQGRDAVDGYVWLDDPALVLSAGPTYSRAAADDDPPPEPPSIPLGFAPPRIERDPRLWDGDQA